MTVIKMPQKKKIVKMFFKYSLRVSHNELYVYF